MQGSNLQLSSGRTPVSRRQIEHFSVTSLIEYPARLRVIFCLCVLASLFPQGGKPLNASEESQAFLRELLH
ncbi:hypothetical protein N8843_02335 [Verrucomicrobia bacterium]|nr:hypothetical protein [Verrucomicrobiota bacterium]